MSIPHNDNLNWAIYNSNPDWHKSSTGPAPENLNDGEFKVRRAVGELFAQGVKQPVVRGVQFIRDTLRLVLKVPVRAIWTPIVLEKNWKERQRSLINAKLTGYSFVQLVSVPAKFLVAIAAILTSAISQKKAQWLLDKSDGFTAHLDGRASQLEALKEEGIKNAPTRIEYEQYKAWLYQIDPKLCRKPVEAEVKA